MDLKPIQAASYAWNNNSDAGLIGVKKAANAVGAFFKAVFELIQFPEPSRIIISVLKDVKTPLQGGQFRNKKSETG